MHLVGFFARVPSFVFVLLPSCDGIHRSTLDARGRAWCRRRSWSWRRPHTRVPGSTPTRHPFVEVKGGALHHRVRQDVWTVGWVPGIHPISSDPIRKGGGSERDGGGENDHQPGSDRIAPGPGNGTAGLGLVRGSWAVATVCQRVWRVRGMQMHPPRTDAPRWKRTKTWEEAPRVTMPCDGDDGTCDVRVPTSHPQPIHADLHVKDLRIGRPNHHETVRNVHAPSGLLTRPSIRCNGSIPRPGSAVSTCRRMERRSTVVFQPVALSHVLQWILRPTSLGCI